MLRQSSHRDLVREFLAYIQVEKGLSANTLQSYARDIAKLKAWADQQRKPIEKLERKDLREWISRMSRDGLSPSSIARALSAARGFFRFLMLDNHIEKHPAEDLRSPQRPSPLPKFLSEEEMERLLLAPDIQTDVGVRDRALLELLYAAGLRVSEACGLRVADLELDAALIRCHGKGNKERRVPIGKSAVHWLQRYLAQRKQFGNEGKPQLFLHRGHLMTRQTAWSIIKAYAATAGVPDISPHTLRHSFGTHLMQHGADSRSVQALLGHADISTTEIYTHITDLHMRKAYDRFHPRARVASGSAPSPSGDESGRIDKS
ncbi:MAG TPA: site-specific tyrosine recombinase XerD [Pyrinomonadaceae bacterium]|jgi:integrase/recombinase XerD|nr:site-specific tyrosine recombinase XerD [Pyrinomonadaceae bacterium]